jgi:NADH dehydrogenase
VTCLPTLQVADGDTVLEGAWSAGDCAQVPDLTKPPGAWCSPSAQHAVRQAKQVADNIAMVVLGGRPKEYRHKYVGSVAGLGLYKGVANVYGVKLKGFPAWMMHRTYHMSRIPSFNRKVRVVADWTLAFLLRREVVALGQLHTPRDEFTHVTPEIPASRAKAGV